MNITITEISTDKRQLTFNEMDPSLNGQHIEILSAFFANQIWQWNNLHYGDVTWVTIEKIELDADCSKWNLWIKGNVVDCEEDWKYLNECLLDTSIFDDNWSLNSIWKKFITKQEWKSWAVHNSDYHLYYGYNIFT